MSRQPHSFSILLVEDDPADALMFSELLSEVAPEVKVFHVEHGRAALDFLRGKEQYAGTTLPSLVVLDLNMPVMNGYEFLKEAKQLDVIKRVPILVLSTSDRAADIEHSYDSQAAGYIVKPSNYADYVQILNIIQSYWAGVVRLPSVEEVAQRL